MIRYAYFSFVLSKMKNEKKKRKKNHVLYIPSFRFSFSGSIIENRKKVIKFPFFFFLIHKQKRKIEIWSVKPNFVFSIRNVEKGTTEK